MKYQLTIFILFQLSVSFSQNIGKGIIDIDGNNYKTVIIGSQEWMNENLMVSHFNNGDNILQVKDSIQWVNFGETRRSALCNYNSPLMSNPYDYLYNWCVVNDSRNVCPTNWHVPSKVEWQTLIDFLSPDLKSKLIHPLYWNDNDSMSVNFNAIPVGIRNPAGKFMFEGEMTRFWSSTPDEISFDNNYSWELMIFSAPIVFLSKSNNINGNSIRCIKDGLFLREIKAIMNLDLNAFTLLTDSLDLKMYNSNYLEGLTNLSYLNNSLYSSDEFDFWKVSFEKSNSDISSLLIIRDNFKLYNGLFDEIKQNSNYKYYLDEKGNGYYKNNEFTFSFYNKYIENELKYVVLIVKN